MSKDFISINGVKIGLGYKPYIIAELSANHNGSIEKAFAAIEAAAKTGVDAIKIQSYTADTMTIDSDKADFKISSGLWQGYTLYQLYQQAHTPFEWHKPLFEKAKSVGITLFSTPFDESAVDLLVSLDAPAYKIASFELTDLPLIKYVAQTKKPMIMSTGMASIDEIEQAIVTAKENGCSELVVLHCISAYPAPAEQSNLATIKDIADRFQVLAGLSDHTLGTSVAVASVALGACLIEKHFTLDRNDQGPDSSFSLQPEEFKTLVADTATVHKAIGQVNYQRGAAEQESVKHRRSLYFVRDLKSGDTITEQDIKRIRPGLGLAPKYYSQVLGQKVNQNIERGTAVSWALINQQ